MTNVARVKANCTENWREFRHDSGTRNRRPRTSWNTSLLQLISCTLWKTHLDTLQVVLSSIYCRLLSASNINSLFSSRPT